jgi:molybdate transport system substrate-binding protein
VKHGLFLLSGIILVMTSGGAVRAAEITLIAPGGIRAPLEQLIPDFERRTGDKIIVTFGSGGGTKDRVARGDPFDVPVVQPPYANVLASGNVMAQSETPLASVAVGIAVRAGAPKPDISSVDAVKRVLLTARAISYPDPALGAAAGVSFTATLQKLGIAAALQPKTILAQGGANAMARLAKGEVDIGLTFISEIITEPGIELVGALPREISTPTAFVAFVSSHAKEPDAAQALVRFLAAPEAAAIYQARGMEPGG